MVNLDIISDPICPWCFIGKANLEKALEGKVNLIFNIRRYNLTLSIAHIFIKIVIILKFHSSTEIASLPEIPPPSF